MSCTKAATPQAEASSMQRMVTAWAARSPMALPNRPAVAEPNSGAKTATANSIDSALHQVDVLDLNRAAIAEIDDHDGEPDRRLGGGDGEGEHDEHLADHVVEGRREGHEVQIGGEQDQLDRHH